MAYKAVLIGASGLIGSRLLNILIDSPEYSDVLILCRRKLPVTPLKVTQLVVDFDRLDKHKGDINGHAIFSCLGTTREQTPDKKTYRKIDHDYPVQLATIAKATGINQFHIITCVGADAKSANGYLKMKGEIENDIKAIGLPVLNIYQPSMLVGNRRNKRFAEVILGAIMTALNPVLVGGLKKYQSIKAEALALAMYKQSLRTSVGIHTFTIDKIKEIK